jgi:hypothetical protein
MNVVYGARRHARVCFESPPAGALQYVNSDPYASYRLLYLIADS